MQNKLFIKNTIMLYLMSFAKMLLPFFTLPYLTRILTTEGYGVVAYIKSVMLYVQIIVDFGFTLSITKEVVLNKHNKKKVSEICSDTLLSRIILWSASFLGILLLSLSIKILRENLIYAIYAMLAILITCFLPDYLFIGYESMEILSYRFIVSKVASTILTFVIVKGDNDMLFIPILDILGNLIAMILTYRELKRMNIFINIQFKRIKNAFLVIARSLNYFLSNLASNLLGFFSTMLIGIYLSPSSVAFWSVANNLIGTIQSLYNPISDSLYPQMIKRKDIRVVFKILGIFIPLIIIGCLLSYILAPDVILLIAGDKYNMSVIIFRLLIPVLLISFISIIFGWPTLGAISKSKENMITTVISASIQISILIVLILNDQLTLWNIAIARIVSECILCLSRCWYVFKFRKVFVRE